MVRECEPFAQSKDPMFVRAIPGLSRSFHEAAGRAARVELE